MMPGMLMRRQSRTDCRQKRICCLEQNMYIDHADARCAGSPAVE
jgi:hypothetical protein